jgi:uncharacterized protein YbaR (Trm112 family)
MRLSYFLGENDMESILLEILACPVCKGELVYDKPNAELICRFDRLVYPIVDDIPVMLASRARRLSDEE